MSPIYISIDPGRTGQNITRLMSRRGLKVKDLQEACGFEKPQAVYKWIHGASIPSIDNLLVLAKLFSTNVEGILVTEDALSLWKAMSQGDGSPAFSRNSAESPYFRASRASAEKSRRTVPVALFRAGEPSPWLTWLRAFVI